MPDDPDLTAAVAEEARKRSPEERTAYLDGVCAARPELREGVEEILKDIGNTARPHDEVTAHLMPSDPGEAPNAFDATMMRPELAIEEGASVGPYRLLQQLGEGGMGVVYMAEQQHPVRRKVALKIIKPGMDTREVLARFEAERQALAMMDHPNIAHVLDAGSTTTGSPYFVMELVKGVPMTEYCDIEKLDTRARLALFVDVCRAVQHAHQKGIIHRDLKPLNILVAVNDGRPVPKVIDFGVAKAIGSSLTEKTLFTRISQPVGTPAYMSPEQAEMTGLDIDTRSDIYSLGVLLYELLTGTTPLEPKRLSTASFIEMQRIIREEEPQRPSMRLSTLGDARLVELAGRRKVPPTRLGYEIKGELDWIVMKALEKDRTRRYDTADAFAQDVQHYLSGELVLARPPSTSYRLRKFARRYRRWIATGAAMFVLMIAGTIVSTWQAIRATRAEGEARAAEAVAEERRERAVAAEEAATQAKEQAEAVANFLVNTFRSPDPEREGREITMAEMLSRAADEVITGFNDALLTKADLLGALGTTYKSLGMPTEAIKLLSQARAIWQAEGVANDPDVLMRMATLASAYYDAGDREQAEKLYNATLQNLQFSLRTVNVRTTGAARGVADILLASGQTAAAVELYEKVLAEQREVLAADHPEMLTTEASLANAHQKAGNTEQAIGELEALLPRMKKSPSLGPEHLRTLDTMNLLADAYMHSDRLAEAIALFDETHGIQLEKLGPSDWRTATTAGFLAQAYRRDGQTEKAIAVHQNALDRLKAELGPTHERTLVAKNNLAVALGQGGRLDEGVTLLTEAVGEMRAGLSEDHPETLKALQNLAHLHWLAGDARAAMRPQREAMEGFRKIYEEGSLRALSAAARLVEIYVAMGANVEAVILAEDVIGKLIAIPEHAEILAALQPAYALALLKQERFEDAQKVAQQLVNTYVPTSENDWYLANLKYLLGRAQLGLKQFADAEPNLLAGLEGLQASMDQTPPAFQNCVRDAASALASFYEQRARPGDDEQAQKYRAIADGEAD